MSDYEYWENALTGNFGPVHDDEAHCGFWRKRTSRSGPFVPVATWRVDTGMACLIDGKPADAGENWTYFCRNPVTEEQYRTRVDTGKWHDESEAVTASLAQPGHNQPDEIDSLKDQISAALAGVDGYAEVKDDETAAKAQSLRSRLLELSRTADKTREEKKRPHFEAGKAVDELYQPLVKASKAGADAIAKALSAHETRKAREEADRQAVERRRLADEAAKLPAAAKPEPAPEPAPAPVAAPIKGAYGRAAAVKVVKVATVVDQDAAYAHLKSQPELGALIQKLAQKLVDSGFSIPGVEITEERKVS